MDLLLDQQLDAKIFMHIYQLLFIKQEQAYGLRNLKFQTIQDIILLKAIKLLYGGFQLDLVFLELWL